MMISESISSGKIVTTLFPEKVVTPERYKNHIDLYLNKGFIFRSKIGDQLVLRKNNDHSQKIEESRKTLVCLLFRVFSNQKHLKTLLRLICFLARMRSHGTSTTVSRSALNQCLRTTVITTSR